MASKTADLKPRKEESSNKKLKINRSKTQKRINKPTKAPK